MIFRRFAGLGEFRNIATDHIYRWSGVEAVHQAYREDMADQIAKGWTMDDLPTLTICEATRTVEMVWEMTPPVTP